MDLAIVHQQDTHPERLRFPVQFDADHTLFNAFGILHPNSVTTRPVPIGQNVMTPGTGDTRREVHAAVAHGQA